MQDSKDKTVRTQLAKIIAKSEAHATLEKALKDLPADKRGIAPYGLPYSIWQLVDHIRIAQHDLLEFSKNPNHKSPKWPDEYWAKEAAPADEKAWADCLQQITADRDAMIALINDEAADLYQPIPHGGGQTILREALLVIDHVGYHTAEIIVLRRLLGAWKV